MADSARTAQIPTYSPFFPEWTDMSLHRAGNSNPATKQQQAAHSVGGQSSWADGAASGSWKASTSNGIAQDPMLSGHAYTGGETYSGIGDYGMLGTFATGVGNLAPAYQHTLPNDRQDDAEIGNAAPAWQPPLQELSQQLGNNGGLVDTTLNPAWQQQDGAGAYLGDGTLQQQPVPPLADLHGSWVGMQGLAPPDVAGLDVYVAPMYPTQQPTVQQHYPLSLAQGGPVDGNRLSGGVNDNVGPIIHETTHGNRFMQAGNSLGLSGEPDGKSQSSLQHQQYCFGPIVMNTPMDPMHSSAFGSGRPMMIMPDNSRNFAMRPDLGQYGLRVRLREEGYFEELTVAGILTSIELLALDMDRFSRRVAMSRWALEQHGGSKRRASQTLFHKANKRLGPESEDAPFRPFAAPFWASGEDAALTQSDWDDFIAHFIKSEAAMVKTMAEHRFAEGTAESRAVVAAMEGMLVLRLLNKAPLTRDLYRIFTTLLLDIPPSWVRDINTLVIRKFHSGDMFVG